MFRKSMQKLKKRYVLISIGIAILLAAAVSFAFFSDRVISTNQIKTGSFDAGNYNIERSAPEGYFSPGDTIDVVFKESNQKDTNMLSEITLTAEWDSPVPDVYPWGNTGSGNLKVSIDGAEIPYTVNKDHTITISLPQKELSASTNDIERNLTFEIPSDLNATGTLKHKVKSIELTKESSNWSSSYDSDKLSDLNFNYDIAWNISLNSVVLGEPNRDVLAVLTSPDTTETDGYGLRIIKNGQNTNINLGRMMNWNQEGETPWASYSIVSLSIDEKISTIGNYAFAGEEGITFLNLPSTIEGIGISAFDGSGLTGEITIPASVYHIESLAFGNLSNVNVLTFKHKNGDNIVLPDNESEGTKTKGAFYVRDYVKTTINAEIDPILQDYNWVNDHRAKIGIKEVYLSYEDVEVGKTIAPALTILPENYDAYQSIRYKIVSGDAYISIDSSSGVVTGLAEGTATVQVTIVGANGKSVVQNTSVRVIKREPVLAAQDTWFTQGDTGLKKSQVTSITFSDKAVPATYSASWDASEGKTGGITAYAVDNNPAPTTKPASDLDVGDSVYLNVNGVKREFIVVQQGNPDSSIYDASCNGTWLMMKNVYESRTWADSNTNTSYEASTIHPYLNSTFLSLLDPNVQSAIKQVKIPYGLRDKSGSNNKNLTLCHGSNGLSTKIFLLSSFEVGIGGGTNPEKSLDGKLLSYFSDSSKLPAYNLGGAQVEWWTRTVIDTLPSHATITVTMDSTRYPSVYPTTSYGVRPAFILSEDAQLDPETNEIVAGSDSNSSGGEINSDSTYSLHIVGNGSGSIKANTDSSSAFSGFTSATAIDNLKLLNTTDTTNMSSMFKSFGSDADVGLLPKGYTQLEYIEATGTQYINTGFKANNNTRVVAKVLWTEEGWAFGSDTSWHNNGFGVHSHITYYGTTSIDFTYVRNKIFEIDASKNVFVIGDLSPITHTQMTFASGLDMYLFCCNRSGTIDDTMSGRMYLCKVYDNGSLVRDYIPCSNASGEVGLYDTVNKVFYGNAGTGTFTAGPSVQTSTIGANVSFDLSNLDTSSVTSFSEMFANCTTLESLDVSNFDTSAVTSASGLSKFAYNCTSLTDITLGQNFGQNTNVATAGKTTGMFYVPSYVETTVDGANAVMNLDAYDWATDNRAKNEPILAANSTWYDQGNHGIERTSITSIEFSKSTAPSSYYKRWDASEGKVGTVTAYAVADGSNYKLYLVGNGSDKIYSNPDSTFTFSVSSSISSARFTNLKTIVNLGLLDTSNATNMHDMFWGCSSLTSLDLSSFNTSKVTDMNCMFQDCSSLTSLNVSSFNTSQVTDMNNMFRECSSLTSLNVNNFNTSQVADMKRMFYNCKNLTSLDLSNFNTSQVTNMNNMFSGCYSVTSLDVSNFNTSQVTNMSYMFFSCNKLTNLDVSNFNTSQVTDMSRMFTNCYDLTSLDVSNFNTSQVTNMSSMFNSCGNLTSLNVSNFNTSQVTDISNMFANCYDLTSLDVSNFNTSQVTDMSRMFNGCHSLTSLDLSSFSTASISSSSKLNGFAMLCLKLKTITLSEKFCKEGIYPTPGAPNGMFFLNDMMRTTVIGANSVMKTYDWAADNRASKDPILAKQDTWFTQGDHGLATTQISSIEFSDVAAPSSYYKKWDASDSSVPGTVTAYAVADGSNYKLYLVGNGSGKIYANSNSLRAFNNFQALTGFVNLSLFDTSKTTNMNQMFCYCYNLADIDLSTFDTSNVKYMQYMFYCCYDLDLHGVENWKTGNVTNMQDMFYQCWTLSSLDLSEWNTGKVTTMKNMFNQCTGLTSLDLSGWSNTVVEDMQWMIANCTSLKTLNLSNFGTNKVTNMQYMFTYSYSITSLDLRSFNTSNVTTMYSMFSDCSGLNTLLIDSSFNTDNVTTMFSMFNGCSSLTSLDVSNFNTSKVTSMQSMFNSCSSLTSLDVSSFNTSNVTSMGNMFANCSSLTALDLSNFDTSKVTGMYAMFYKCAALKTLDINNFITSSLSSPGNMFNGCSAPITIYVSNSTVQSWVKATTNFPSSAKVVIGKPTATSDFTIQSIGDETSNDSIK